MRGIIMKLIGEFSAWLSTPIVMTEQIKLSWSDVEMDNMSEAQRNQYIKKPRIFLYAKDNCNICQEIKLWLESLWIPYVFVKCSMSLRPHVLKLRHLQQYAGVNAKVKNKKSLIFMMPTFPQLDVCRIDKSGKYVWTRYIGNSKRLRENVESFVGAHIGAFPGFEQGLYADLNSEQSVKWQQDAIASEQLLLGYTDQG